MLTRLYSILQRIMSLKFRWCVRIGINENVFQCCRGLGRALLNVTCLHLINFSLLLNLKNFRAMYSTKKIERWCLLRNLAFINDCLLNNVITFFEDD